MASTSQFPGKLESPTTITLTTNAIIGSPNDPQLKSSSDGKSSAIAVGGGATGACIAIAIFLVVLFLYCKRRKHPKRQSNGYLANMSYLYYVYSIYTVIVVV